MLVCVPCHFGSQVHFVTKIVCLPLTSVATQTPGFGVVVRDRRRALCSMPLLTDCLKVSLAEWQVERWRGTSVCQMLAATIGEGVIFLSMMMEDGDWLSQILASDDHHNDRRALQPQHCYNRIVFRHSSSKAPSCTSRSVAPVSTVTGRLSSTGGFAVVTFPRRVFEPLEVPLGGRPSWLRREGTQARVGCGG